MHCVVGSLEYMKISNYQQQQFTRYVSINQKPTKQYYYVFLRIITTILRQNSEITNQKIIFREYANKVKQQKKNNKDEYFYHTSKQNFFDLLLFSIDKKIYAQIKSQPKQILLLKLSNMLDYIILENINQKSKYLIFQQHHIYHLSIINISLMMKEFNNQIDQILQQKSIIRVKQLLSSITQQEKANTLKELEIILINHQYKQQTFDNDGFRITLLEQIISLSNNMNSKHFKTLSIFDLIAVGKGYIRNGQEKQKIRSQFTKNIKKDNQFWGVSKIQAFKSNLVDKSLGYRPIWTSNLHNDQLQKIKYFINFYEQNVTMFPATLQIRNYILRYILMLRIQNQQQKNLYQKLNKIFFASPYHLEILNRNFRFCLQFMRNSFNQKQFLYYPQKSIVNILANYKKIEIEHFMTNCSLGLTWRYEQLASSIINCIKLGITENTSRIIKGFIQVAKNHDKYSQIIKVFQSNISKLFIFMKHPKLFPVSFDLLKEFILGPPPSSNLYSNFIEKAIPFTKILSNEHLQQFLQLLEIVKDKYKETTITTQIQTTIQSYIANGYQPLSTQLILKIRNSYDWRIFDKKIIIKNQTNQSSKNIEGIKKYKGLINIGNSCYMNSFIQCLFLTKQFRRQLLKVSTLALEKQILSKLSKQYENEKNVQIASIARQYVRPLAQLQRLFCLLLKSQRSEITPQSVKTYGPVEFRNGFQQDSIEYGRSLLETIHRISFEDLFKGTLTIQIQCQQCKQKRSKNQQFVDLMISYEKKQQSDEANNNEITIEEMLSKSLQDEKVSDLTCDKCNRKSQNSLKKHWVSKLPNYLILTIKRFEYDIKEKKNKKKQFKINMNQIFQLHQNTYQIYAIIVHRGVSANSGHYFTFGRQNISMSSRWICFNDTQIDIIPDFNKVKQFLESCPQDTPYIIFGQKLDYVMSKQKQLEQTIILRPPLLNFVEKDNIQFLKSSQKNPFVFNLKNINFDRMFRRDDDSDQQGGMMGKGNIPPPII